MMIKPQKESPRARLKDLQLHQEELDRTRRSPLHFYNTYVRKEGQPVLSEEQYKKMMAEQYAKTKTSSEPGFKFVDEIPTELSKQLETIAKLRKDADEHIKGVLGISEKMLGSVENVRLKDK